MYGIKFYVNSRDINNPNIEHEHKKKAVVEINSKFYTNFSIDDCEIFYDYMDRRNIYNKKIDATTGDLALYKGEFVGWLGFDVEIVDYQVALKIFIKGE